VRPSGRSWVCPAFLPGHHGHRGVCIRAAPPGNQLYCSAIFFNSVCQIAEQLTTDAGFATQFASLYNLRLHVMRELELQVPTAASAG
jgi:hypothetical protein